ncbi:DUF4386 domain-containing protein [Pinirhizobacter sp.]|jgi:hypothetical protein|uniref:DUF4386 domain-containing protein n=1 Tax=Pinirhizobacter sp. TaxID=2950432 RepID=UPI002F3FE04E
MDSINKTARTAGLAYLVNIVTGIFSLLYVPSHVMVRGDAAATFNHIVASESLFRLGIVAGVVAHVAFLVLPLVLYKLLCPVNRPMAVLMVALAVVAVPIDIIAIVNQLDVLTLIKEASHQHAFTADQTYARAQSSLASYSNGLIIAQIFWGLWLLPFGYLVFKSGFLPKFLGIFLMLGCIGYLIIFIADILFPQYDVPGFVMLPASIGEIGIALWMAIVGARRFLFVPKGQKT